MSAAQILAETPPFILHFGSILRKMSDHEFFEFCQANREWRFERTGQGDLIVMSPTGGKAGRRNFILNALFHAWAERDGTGLGFDSSTGFTLPNGAMRSPDLAWVSRPRWEALAEAEQEEFPPLCPDFVVELRSRSDALRDLQEKMQDYIANGARLGWLIDPLERKVYIYRPSAETVCLKDPDAVSGDPELPGFALDAQRLWL